MCGSRLRRICRLNNRRTVFQRFALKHRVIPIQERYGVAVHCCIINSNVGYVARNRTKASNDVGRTFNSPTLEGICILCGCILRRIYRYSNLRTVIRGLRANYAFTVFEGYGVLIRRFFINSNVGYVIRNRTKAFNDFGRTFHSPTQEFVGMFRITFLGGICRYGNRRTVIRGLRANYAFTVFEGYGVLIRRPSYSTKRAFGCEPSFTAVCNGVLNLIGLIRNFNKLDAQTCSFFNICTSAIRNVDTIRNRSFKCI